MRFFTSLILILISFFNFSKKATVSILDDIGSMFDDLADQLDAMLDWSAAQIFSPTKSFSPLSPPRLVMCRCKKKTLPRLNAGSLKRVCLSVGPPSLSASWVAMYADEEGVGFQGAAAPAPTSWCQEVTPTQPLTSASPATPSSLSCVDREAQSRCSSFKRKKREDKSKTCKTKHIDCLKGRLNRSRTDEVAERIYKSTQKDGPLSESV